MTDDNDLCLTFQGTFPLLTGSAYSEYVQKIYKTEVLQRRQMLSKRLNS